VRVTRPGWLGRFRGSLYALAALAILAVTFLAPDALK
jgi:hypothetical protein